MEAVDRPAVAARAGLEQEGRTVEIRIIVVLERSLGNVKDQGDGLLIVNAGREERMVCQNCPRPAEVAVIFMTLSEQDMYLPLQASRCRIKPVHYIKPIAMAIAWFTTV